MLSFKSNWRSDIIPLSFKKAIIEPENVIAPIAAPKDISIRLAKFYISNTTKIECFWI